MKKALLATDASEASLRAAIELGELGRLNPELTVTILHVVPLPEVLTPAAAAGAPLTLPGRLDEYLQTRVDEVLERTIQALGLPTGRYKVTHTIGIPGDAILSEAKLGGYDLIVMGRRGLSPIREMFLGSVSQAVLHRCTCPLLLVP
jgi:nucleotide-binding universal stress UspA family protein